MCMPHIQPLFSLNKFNQLHQHLKIQALSSTLKHHSLLTLKASFSTSDSSFERMDSFPSSWCHEKKKKKKKSEKSPVYQSLWCVPLLVTWKPSSIQVLTQTALQQILCPRAYIVYSCLSNGNRFISDLDSIPSSRLTDVTHDVAPSYLVHEH